jgi:hypothetical protein
MLKALIQSVIDGRSGELLLLPCDGTDHTATDLSARMR